MGGKRLDWSVLKWSIRYSVSYALVVPRLQTGTDRRREQAADGSRLQARPLKQRNMGCVPESTGAERRSQPRELISTHRVDFSGCSAQQSGSPSSSSGRRIRALMYCCGPRESCDALRSFHSNTEVARRILGACPAVLALARVIVTPPIEQAPSRDGSSKAATRAARPGASWIPDKTSDVWSVGITQWAGIGRLGQPRRPVVSTRKRRPHATACTVCPDLRLTVPALHRRCGEWRRCSLYFALAKEGRSVEAPKRPPHLARLRAFPIQPCQLPARQEAKPL